MNGYADAWYQWIGEKGFVTPESEPTYYAERQGITHLKYALTGALNLREAGSAVANVRAYESLSRLNPPQRMYESSPFKAFNTVTRRMWGICDTELCCANCECIPFNDDPFCTNNTNSDLYADLFPGMMPTLHPVFDGMEAFNHADCGEDTTNCIDSRENRADKTRAVPEQARIALKRCPNANGTQCCLALEGEATPDVDLIGVSFAASFEPISDRTEHKIRWNTVAAHTSFSRGVPDLRFYKDDALRMDLRSTPKPNPPDYYNSTGNSKLQENLLHFLRAMTSLTDTGFTEDSYDRWEGPDAEYDSFARALDGHHQVSTKTRSKVDFRMAHYLEHYYTALVGVEEAKSLSQAHAFEKYDRKRYADDVKNSGGKTANQAHHEACGNMPAGTAGTVTRVTGSLRARSLMT